MNEFVKIMFQSMEFGLPGPFMGHVPPTVTEDTFSRTELVRNLCMVVMIAQGQQRKIRPAMICHALVRLAIPYY